MSGSAHPIAHDPPASRSAFARSRYCSASSSADVPFDFFLGMVVSVSREHVGLAAFVDDELRCRLLELGVVDVALHDERAVG